MNFIAGLIASLGILLPAGGLLAGGILALRSLWRARQPR